MESEDEAQKAIDMFNGQDMKGRNIVVNEARPPQPRGDRPRRNFGGRRGGVYRGDRNSDRYAGEQNDSYSEN